MTAEYLYICSAFISRRKKQAYNFEVLPMNMFILQLVFVSLIIIGVTWILAGYNGMSWTFVVVMIVVRIYSFITTQTVLGRHIYATGGNPEAAQLSGSSAFHGDLHCLCLDGYALGFVGHLVRISLAVRYDNCRCIV